MSAPDLICSERRPVDLFDKRAVVPIPAMPFRGAAAAFIHQKANAIRPDQSTAVLNAARARNPPESTS